MFAPDFADRSRIYAIVSSRDQLRRRLHRLRLKPAGARGAEKRAAIDGGLRPRRGPFLQPRLDIR